MISMFIVLTLALTGDNHANTGDRVILLPGLPLVASFSGTYHFPAYLYSYATCLPITYLRTF